MANTAESAFTDGVILFDKNPWLVEQNKDGNIQALIKTTVVGVARVLSYKDILEVRESVILKT
jgi:hypothetical protein